MQNYEKSASVARMLGVDPALAKVAINTAKSNFSSLMPLSMRKIVINSILDMGLSTLALLARPGYVLGDVRVKLVQRMVESKGSLPLIFPKEDIDFDYSPSFASNYIGSRSNSHADSPSLVKRIFGSGYINEEVSLPLLREGGRIPHCWFYSPLSKCDYSKSSYIPGDIISNSGEILIEQRDRMLGLGYDQSIFSSVSLSAFAHASETASTLSSETTTSVFSVPKVTIRL